MISPGRTCETNENKPRIIQKRNATNSPKCGNQPTKIRLIDDFRASAINAIVETEDANIPDTLDSLIAVSSFFALVKPGCDLYCATADFAHAYKHVPILEDHRQFATILLAPPQGDLKAACLRTQPFGSKRAPTNWPRVTLFLKWLMLTVFNVVINVYVDDVFIVETAETINNAFLVFKAVCELLGFQLEVSKQQEPTKTPNLLGAEITLTQRWITARLPGRKRKDLINELKQALSNGTLTPAQAAKLRGRLGFSQSLLFGRMGRALLNPLSARQYSKTSGRFHPLNEQLKQTLEWWIEILRTANPRRTMLTPPKPCVVYCDASGTGHIGFYIKNGEEIRTGNTHLPEWFTKIGGIFEYELAGAIYALFAASVVWPGLPILLCVDNSAAAATLVRGNCPSDLGAILAAVFWCAAASSSTPVWVEEVRSKFNVADTPSRLCAFIPDRPSFHFSNHGVPDTFADVFANYESLLRARTKSPAQGQGFLSPWECTAQNAESNKTNAETNAETA